LPARGTGAVLKIRRKKERKEGRKKEKKREGKTDTDRHVFQMHRIAILKKKHFVLCKMFVFTSNSLE
jgi:hypothetical protein